MDDELKPQEVEPVAWRARHSETERWYLFEYRPSWWEVQPLYDHPDPAPAPAVPVEGELERLRAENAGLRASRRDMHRRAQKAESRFHRVKWWQERILEVASARGLGAITTYLRATERLASPLSGTAFCMAATYYHRRLRALEAEIAALRDQPAPQVKALQDALDACRIIDEVIREGHDNLGEMVLHFLTAGEPARAAISALSGEAQR